MKNNIKYTVISVIGICIAGMLWLYHYMDKVIRSYFIS